MTVHARSYIPLRKTSGFLANALTCAILGAFRKFSHLYNLSNDAVMSALSLQKCKSIKNTLTIFFEDLLIFPFKTASRIKILQKLKKNKNNSKPSKVEKLLPNHWKTRKSEKNIEKLWKVQKSLKTSKKLQKNRKKWKIAEISAKYRFLAKF